MWRCHCGEVNINSARRCADCGAPKLTHGDESGEPKARPSRRRNVLVGFLGMGLRQPDERRMPGAAERTLSESEIAAYYASQRRRSVLNGILYVAAAAAVVGLLAWQLFRNP